MYRKPAAHQLKFENFYLPFGGFLKRLRRDNRWVILAKQIPWQKIEDEYSANFNGLGCPAKPARVALGSLIIKERLGSNGLLPLFLPACVFGINRGIHTYFSNSGGWPG